ncbi:hypothetical protein F2Q68_00043238 [Brassica cretica]|uniref:Aspartic peptidase DDI1-type domain-containing protein n=1 Tax=Brassica cretica TaxID=69181 RepID=A0A8S9LQQ5_BRACR|nr:hypothetical protein F2Q68_00043238 [Brassica cretica]
MQVDEATEGGRLRKRKEKIPKTLKREANEKEMDGFTKRVLRILVEKPFDEVYFTHRLWMFFRETKETEEDIRRMFYHVRERMKLKITLKKKSEPGKFAIPCVVKDDDFWQVVKHEKLGEGDFEDESSMSFDGSHWCRLMSMDTHRSTNHDEDRSTDYSKHRSTSSAESTAECSAVPIMTHEEFAEKHPHPPSPFYVKIDRPHEPAVDRQRETDIDRTPSPLIDRRTPLTFRVRLPSIDNDRINALRLPPKPLANPPEPTTNPSDTTPEPMQVDEATKGRRETKETEEDIRRMFHHVRERLKLRITLKKKSHPGKFAIPCVVKGIEFPHALCDTGASVNLVELGNDLGYIAACHCGAEYEIEYSESIDTHTESSIDSNESLTTDEHYPTSLDGKHPDPTEEYDEDYWKERAIEITMQDDRYSSHSFNNMSPPSIDRVYSASVDTHPHPAK